MNLREFGYFFAVQFAMYSLICWNMRAIALASYPSIAVSDMMFAAFSFTVI